MAIVNGFSSGGLPPTGRGIYARAQSVDWLAGFDFVALHRARRDTPQKARDLMARGVSVWLYSTPAEWAPGAWQAELQIIGDMALNLGVAGIIADPENGWPSVSRAVRDREASALGAGLAELAMSTRVGVTSYPAFPARRQIAAACEGRVWGSPQIYDKGYSAERIFAFYSDWLALFGDARVIPSISAWPSSRSGSASTSRLRTREGFRAYLTQFVPPAVGAIGWPTQNAAPYFKQEILAWHPGGPLVFARAAGAWITSPIGIGAALVALVALAILGASSRVS